MQPKIQDSASIPQLHKTLLFSKTYGWLDILTGMSLLMLHIICLSFWPISQDNFISSSNTVGVISVLFVVKFEYTIFFYSFCIQIEIYCTFTAVSGLVFYYKKFCAVKFIVISLASSEFLLSNGDVSFRIYAMYGLLTCKCV